MYSFIMEKRLSLESASPALVGANWYQFQSGERISHSHVASVSFLWAVEGHGYIQSGGISLHISPGFLIKLPWMHDIHYEADRKSPFHLGTLHLVPLHSNSLKVEPRVAHLADDPLLISDSRSASTAIGIPQISTLGRSYSKNIVQLGTFAITKFSLSEGNEFLYRSLGQLIDAEEQIWQGDTSRTESYPNDLITMMNFVRDNLSLALEIEDILAVVNCSASTANRLFKRHLDLSLKAWVRNEKMVLAARLLRETSMRVNEVARSVGFSDALYFSQTFKKYCGLSPRDYVKKSLRP